MKKLAVYLLLSFISITLTACSSLTEEQPTPTANTATTVVTPHLSESSISSTPIGGFIQNSMDENDKSKLWHALDSAVGKPTHWTNANTNIDYTVVPTRKVSIDGNPFCRRYTISATKGDKKDEVTGTACVGEDSNWKPVRG